MNHGGIEGCFTSRILCRFKLASVTSSFSLIWKGLENLELEKLWELHAPNTLNEGFSGELFIRVRYRSPWSYLLRSRGSSFVSI